MITHLSEEVLETLSTTGHYKFDKAVFSEEEMAETFEYEGQLLRRHRNGGGWVPADQDEHDSSRAYVSEDTYVGPYAIVSGQARVFGSCIDGESRIFGCATVIDSKVTGSAWVLENAHLENALVSGWTETTSSVCDQAVSSMVVDRQVQL